MKRHLQAVPRHVDRERAGIVVHPALHRPHVLVGQRTRPTRRRWRVALVAVLVGVPWFLIVAAIAAAIGGR